MNFYTLTSKRGLKPLTIGIFTALLLSAAWGLAYKWNPAATPTMPASELAGLDTMALMAKFRIQPLDRVPIGNFQLKNLD